MRACDACGAIFADEEVVCRFDGSALPPVASEPTLRRMLAGRYVLGRKLGSGAFGVVYEAEDRKLGKRVAVKVLGPRVASDPYVIERFRREAAAAARIGHKGIVDVTDFDQDANGSSFLVMEYLDGADLAATLAREGRLLPARALRIGMQVAHALAAAHEKGIVHRDLKPPNIFLTDVGTIRDLVKVLDFGISKILAHEEGRPALTGTNQIVGTPSYMAPEQAAGRADLDARVDIYALGCVLYHMLVGRVPFTGATSLAVLQAHLSERPIPPSVASPALPPDVDALVLRALAKDPDARFPTMHEFGEAMAALVPGASFATTIAPIAGRAALRGDAHASSTLGGAAGESRAAEFRSRRWSLARLRRRLPGSLSRRGFIGVSILGMAGIAVLAGAFVGGGAGRKAGGRASEASPESSPSPFRSAREGWTEPEPFVQCPRGPKSRVIVAFLQADRPDRPIPDAATLRAWFAKVPASAVEFYLVNARGKHLVSIELSRDSWKAWRDLEREVPEVALEATEICWRIGRHLLENQIGPLYRHEDGRLDIALMPSKRTNESRPLFGSLDYAASPAGIERIQQWLVPGLSP